MKTFILTVTFIVLGILSLVFAIAAYTFVPVTLIFLTLKLCNVITWNWFMVVPLPMICGLGSALMTAILSVILRAYNE